MKNTGLDIITIAISALCGFVGGLGKAIIATDESNKFAASRFLLDASLGVVIGIVCGSFMLSFDIQIHVIIGVSVLCGIMGKDSLSYMTRALRKKANQITSIDGKK